MNKAVLKIIPVLVILSMLLGACAATLPAVPVVLVSPSATPAPSLTPAPSATIPAAISDDVWDRIVANNKIVVGTSYDYPPFASIDPNFHAVGFDLVLIKEIGQRLNIPVDIQNYSFDGLADALQLNQIDLAVAAISVTPERLSQMSFSPVYYVNQTSVLARKDSTIKPITDFNQLAGLRVGVQRGTTYESMMQQTLVDTGKIAAEKLFRYTHANEAVRDLREKRIDVVVLGQATASYYGDQKDLRVVGDGLQEQDLALAMRLGTPRLKAEIDRVMDEMLTDGTILGFIQQYIQPDITSLVQTPTLVPTVRPIATLIPLVATATPAACWNGMKFVADVTYADKNMSTPPFIKPGDGFVKTWRVQNSGTCTWIPGYQLAYAYGSVSAAQMNGQPIKIAQNVTPGQTIDLSVNLVAPVQPSTYQGFWQIENALGQPFGQTVWVGITTLPDTANPVATGQPAGNFCEVTITAPKTAVHVSESFDSVWTVKNISGNDWTTDSVDYKFISGEKMRENNVYDFSQTIKTGESGKIIVDMIAPLKPGIYNTTWAIVSGNKTLCILTMNITVIAK